MAGCFNSVLWAIRLPTLVLLVSQGRGHSNSLSAYSSSARIHHLPTKHRIKNKNLYSITTSNKGRDCSLCKVAYAGEFKSLVMAMALQSCRSFESILEDWIEGRCFCGIHVLIIFCCILLRLGRSAVSQGLVILALSTSWAEPALRGTSKGLNEEFFHFRFGNAVVASLRWLVQDCIKTVNGFWNLLTVLVPGSERPKFHAAFQALSPFRFVSLSYTMAVKPWNHVKQHAVHRLKAEWWDPCFGATWMFALWHAHQRQMLNLPGLHYNWICTTIES